MVATLSAYSPAFGEEGRADAEERLSLPEVIEQRIQECLAEAGGWISEARLAQRYYRSDQYRKYSNSRDRYRIRLVANFIRRDIDLMVAELLDGEPVVNPSGRNPKHFELGRLLLQVLQWTRDEEDDWDQDLEQAITDMVHIGEGVIYEGWDQDANNGEGMPIARRLDSRYVFWDYSSTSMQRDDADFIIWLEYKPIDHIERVWPQLRGQVQPETAETFITPHQQQYYRSSLGASSYTPLMGPRGAVKKAWIRRQWAKKHKFRRRYWDRETWETAMTYDPVADEERRLEEKDYARLSPDERAGILEVKVPYSELWESTVVSKTLVSHRLSPFDESNGGHGRYPFAFLPCNMLADESHARGEIGFLIQIQDITNEAISQFLNQLFLVNVGYLHSYRGSIPVEEQDKVGLIGKDPMVLLETIPGFPPPSFQGMNPTGIQAASAAIPLIKDVIMDSMSGRHRVDRGQSEWAGMSGKAVRALQARTSLLSTKLVKHVESGLKRSTLLRLHNIMQFMRGNRVLQIADPDKDREKTLIIGHDEVEMVEYHQLSVEKDEENNSVKFFFPDGSEAELLVLNEQVSRDVVYEQVRLKLDTGREKNKLDRQEDARMVLETVGAPALPWVARQLEWADPELLLDEIRKANTGQQVMAQLEEIQKQTGMGISEILQLLTQAVQQQMMMGTEGGVSQGAIPQAPEVSPPPETPLPPAAAGPPPQRGVRPVRPPGSPPGALTRPR